ncbi:MAG TPA: hypothetical protein VFI23_14345 [Rhizomicrobium sp.]|nr:hypothetical protein [Rhizomicrobium sp.]
MRCSRYRVWAAAAIFLAVSSPVLAAPAAPAAPAEAPMVPPAKPGVFALQKRGADRYHLTVAGHKFTTRDEIEKYLLYRAAELTLEQKSGWFTLVESRSKGDTEPPPKADPSSHYSFRLAYWRPVWRYKVTGTPAWTGFSPFSGAAFFGGNPKTITDFEVSADVVLHKGPMNDSDPLAFEAGPVSDLLISQVSPPE